MQDISLCRISVNPVIFHYESESAIEEHCYISTVLNRIRLTTCCVVFFPPKGGDGKLDPVCKEAVAAVENAH